MTDAIDLTPIPERGARRTGRCMGGKRRPVAWATQSRGRPSLLLRRRTAVNIASPNVIGQRRGPLLWSASPVTVGGRSNPATAGRDGGRAHRIRLIGHFVVCYDRDLAFGPLAQLGERLVRNQEVGGSSPPRSTTLETLASELACSGGRRAGPTRSRPPGRSSASRTSRPERLALGLARFRDWSPSPLTRTNSPRCAFRGTGAGCQTRRDDPRVAPAPAYRSGPRRPAVPLRRFRRRARSCH